MRSILLLLSLLVLMVFPASAETLYFEDTDSHVNYAICDPERYKPVGAVYGYQYIDMAVYDTFSCTEDDEFSSVKFHLNDVKSSCELPITFWYENGSKNMSLDVEVTDVQQYLFFTQRNVNISLIDGNSYVILSDTRSDIVLGEHISLIYEPDKVTLGNNDAFDSMGSQSLNFSVFPVKAVSFDLSTLNNENVESYCVIQVADSTVGDTEFEGALGWLYGKVSFMDHDGVLFYVMYFLQQALGLVLFGLDFMVTCTWSYVCLSQAFALFYGVLQSGNGALAMIEGYAKATYWGIYLPVAAFMFFITLLIRLVQAAGSLIPFT